MHLKVQIVLKTYNQSVISIECQCIVAILKSICKTEGKFKSIPSGPPIIQIAP